MAKKVLFIGQEVNGALIEEICKALNLEFDIISHIMQIEKVTENLIARKFKDENTYFDIILFDGDFFIDDSEMIVSEIVKIRNFFSGTDIMMFMPNFSPQSKLCQECRKNDIRKFLISGAGDNLKNQFQKLVTNFTEVNPRAFELELENELGKEAEAKQGLITIGVCGTSERIGTTTQALQIVQYLNFIGYKACYIEAGERTYLDNNNLTNREEEVGFICKYAKWKLELFDDSWEKGIEIENVPMYPQEEGLKKRNEYDYLVFDYGCVWGNSFPKTAYLKDDIQIVVSGVKATEFDMLEPFIDNMVFSQSKFIFSFATDKIIEDFKERIAKNTMDFYKLPYFFANSTPSYFELTNPALYEKVLGIKAKTNDAMEVVEKKRLFNFKFRKGKKNEE